ncbi:hypothetical protein PMAYCL1PPCAC_12708, partial [Pristionchus mayeri]
LLECIQSLLLNVCLESLPQFIQSSFHSLAQHVHTTQYLVSVFLQKRAELILEEFQLLRDKNLQALACERLQGGSVEVRLASILLLVQSTFHLEWRECHGVALQEGGGLVHVESLRGSNELLLEHL